MEGWAWNNHRLHDLKPGVLTARLRYDKITSVLKSLMFGCFRISWTLRDMTSIWRWHYVDPISLMQSQTHTFIAQLSTTADWHIICQHTTDTPCMSIKILYVNWLLFPAVAIVVRFSSVNRGTSCGNDLYQLWPVTSTRCMHLVFPPFVMSSEPSGRLHFSC